MQKTKNSRQVEVLETLMQIPVALHTSELAEPYQLYASVVDDAGVIKLDLRLFYRRIWKESSYFTATDKGIRFTKKDLEGIAISLKFMEETLSDRLFSILRGFTQTQVFQLSDGNVVIFQKVDSPQPYVDVRRHYIHNQTGEATATRRGFKLSSADIHLLREEEVKTSNDLITTAITAINALESR